jgi:hypothetical protein
MRSLSMSSSPSLLGSLNLLLPLMSLSFRMESGSWTNSGHTLAVVSCCCSRSNGLRDRERVGGGRRGESEERREEERREEED